MATYIHSPSHLSIINQQLQPIYVLLQIVCNTTFAVYITTPASKLSEVQDIAVELFNLVGWRYIHIGHQIDITGRGCTFSLKNNCSINSFSKKKVIFLIPFMSLNTKQGSDIKAQCACCATPPSGCLREGQLEQSFYTAC